MNSLSHSAKRRLTGSAKRRLTGSAWCTKRSAWCTERSAWYTKRSAWYMTAAALTVAMFSSGCSTFGPSPVGGFTPLAELLPVALGGDRGLCVGRDGQTSLCVPGPRPKLVVEGLRVNLRQPIEGVLPSHVLCRLKRETDQAVLECVEIYTRLPN